MKNKNTARKVAIMCSGSDSSGSNACLYYLTRNLEKQGFEVYGIIGGYNGLIDCKYKRITTIELQDKINLGGSVLRTGHSERYLTPVGLTQAAKSFKKMGVECIIVIGGAGSFRGIVDGAKYGINYIGVPSTSENDLFFTDYSVGYDSAREANIAFSSAVRTSCFSQNRVPIVEIRGRDCGKLPFVTAIGSGADYCIIKEVPVKLDKVVTSIANKIKEQGDVLIVVSEGAINTEDFADKIAKKSGRVVKIFENGYAQRGADTSGFDREISARLAYECVNLVNSKNYYRAVGLKNGFAYNTSIAEALEKENNLDVDFFKSLYDVE